MNSIPGWFGAMGLVALAAFYPQKSVPQKFSGSDFFDWSAAEQRGYLDAQIVMASSIVTRQKPDMAQCMADHFYSQNGLSDKGFQELTETIRQYETYHPSSVLVVVIENRCGAFY
ncbi:MAG: hypothetical protein AAF636_20575 [Pseudomonadota bacterium]